MGQKMNIMALNDLSLIGERAMDPSTSAPETDSSESSISMKTLDKETIEILIEDKIATGG